MIVSVDNTPMAQVMPIVSGKDVVIGIDSSKTNTALAIGDLSGEVLHWIELNGTADGTSEYDALRLCQLQREALKVLLQGCNLVQVGIEDIITKVQKGKETGMTVHASRFKITCIFASLIAFFQDNFNKTPVLINNWTWKSHILPEEFRSRDIKKGSLAYFRSIGSVYGSCTDDVTDALCILQYLYKYSGISVGTRITGPEVSVKPHKILLTNISAVTRGDAKIFQYNPELTLEQNAAVISNNSNHLGKANVAANQLSFSEIYQYCAGKFERYENQLVLWVLNESR